MVISHVLVALLTIFLTYIAMPVQQALSNRYEQTGYQQVAMSAGVYWMFPDAFEEPLSHYPQTAGYDMIVSGAGEVLLTIGDAPCQPTEMLNICAASMDGTESISTFYRGPVEWTQIILNTTTGHRIISQRAPYDSSIWEVAQAAVNPNWMWRIISQNTPVAVLLSLPLALGIVWLLLRPKIKRIEHIVDTSKRFAAGDLTARANDKGRDDVGEWALRFDDMADALAQTIISLRELAQQNMQLVQQIEQSTIQQERLRLSRDLHDSVAQRLFSLTVSTRSLPDMLHQEPERGLAHARTVAELAQQTLLDLRGLLVDLRPTDVIQLGLGEALRKLCQQTQIAHDLRIDCSVMLFGGHIPAPVQDALYRVAQEALSNAAKHANASQIEVSLVQGQQQINMSVTDNGNGMPPNKHDQGFGLHTMRERTLSLGGHFEIERTPEHGTTVRLQLPLTTKEAPHEPDSDSTR